MMRTACMLACRSAAGHLGAPSLLAAASTSALPSACDPYSPAFQQNRDEFNAVLQAMVSAGRSPTRERIWKKP